MGTKTAKLRRTQLDRFFKDLFLSSTKPPKEGWVKEIRQALGMSLQDLAERVGVIKQRVNKIESDEVAGKLTLETLRNVADAMNCDFVYYLVPRGEGLQKTLEKQAQQAAKEVVANTEYSMQLEEQGTGSLAQKQLIESIAQELLQNEDRRIWKTKREDKKSARGNASRR
ncbi:helix-turn-helix protein [compost metagenome]